MDISTSGFAKKVLIGAMFLQAGQASAGNSFDVMSDYYAAQSFDEITHKKFIELLVKSEGNHSLAKQYAERVVMFSDQEDLSLLRSSNAKLIENAESLVKSRPDKIFWVHKELKDGNYPKPLAIEALYKIHKAYDVHYESYAKEHSSLDEIQQVASENDDQSLPANVVEKSVVETEVEHVFVEPSHHDKFTLMSAPKEFEVLFNELVFEEASNGFEIEPQEIALPERAMSPFDVCPMPEQQVAKRVVEKKGSALTMFEIKSHATLVLELPLNPAELDVDYFVRKDEEIDSLMPRKQYQKESSFYLKEDDFLVEQGASMLWLLALEYV